MPTIDPSVLRLFRRVGIYGVLPLAWILWATGCSGGERTVSYEMREVRRIQPGCDTARAGLCASVSLAYPVFRGKNEPAVREANALARNIVMGEADNEDTLCARFFRQWDVLRCEGELPAGNSAGKGDAADEQQEDECFSLPWYYTVKLEVVEEFRDFVSLHYQGLTNSPFIPGERRYYTLSASTGRAVTAGEVFADTQGLRERLTDKLLEKMEIRRGVPLSEQGLFLPGDGLLPLTDDFAIGEKGAVFHYPMERIAPGGMTEGDLLLPREEMELFIR